MSAVIIHKYVEQNPKRLKKNRCAECANCAMAEKTHILGGGEGYLCKARLYDIKTLACFIPKPCATTVTFGEAIEAVKAGKKISRAGWNGKNQYVELASCISYENAAGETVNADHQHIGNKALAFVGTSGVQLGWLASQADMLADDWIIKE